MSHDPTGSPATAVADVAGAGRVAVVLVHGIGEQRPMATLRGFVRAYARQTAHGGDARPGDARRVWSVPDRVDRTFELHTYVVSAHEETGHPQTDFYEGYWAAQIRGTRVAHLLSWARRILLRRPGSLPARLRWLWWTALAAAVIAAALFGWFLLALGDDPTWTQAAKLLGAAAAPLVVSLLSGSLADAARYLDNRPDNVAARFAVRDNLVTLLQALHDGGRYRRIVVVGHSLGAVIAYDALRLLWARRTVSWDAGAVDDTDAACLALAIARGTATAEQVDRYRDESAELFARVSRPCARQGPLWLVSDLVTIGAPLAYPELLLTPPRARLDDLIEERALPTCPPQLAGTGGAPSFRYPSRTARGRTLRVFHHGAMFAVTRWTNVHARADFVGGPVDAPLGTAVINIELDSDASGWALVPFWSHTRYWTDPGGQQVIRGILDRATRVQERTVKLREQIAMSESELLAFLRDNSMLTCATNGADGWPHVVPLNYLYRDGPELWCWTYGSSQKTRNVERDPRATVQVEDGVAYDELRGAMLKCAVTVHREFDDVVRFGLELLARARGVAPHALDEAVQNRVRRQAAKRVLLQLRPVCRATWDHRKIPRE